MSKHTKGPWRLDGTRIVADSGWIGSVHGSDNARLLLAAPDMYEALKAVLDTEHVSSSAGEPARAKANSLLARIDGDDDPENPTCGCGHIRGDHAIDGKVCMRSNCKCRGFAPRGNTAPDLRVIIAKAHNDERAWLVERLRRHGMAHKQLATAHRDIGAVEAMEEEERIAHAFGMVAELIAAIAPHTGSGAL